MPARFAAFTCSQLALALLASLTGAAWAEVGTIVKPRDGTWIRSEEVEVIARAAGASLHLDGKLVAADEPFPGVLHARVPVAAGPHVLRLASAEGAHEVRFHSGAEAPADAGAPFVDHPPLRIECTHCHSVSRRGRFRFGGGCQACHGEEQFIHTHSHQPHELASCGMCHDAHGSSVAKHLVLPPEQACKQCHN